MKKIITKDRTIDFNKHRIYPDDLPNNTHDIKLKGDEYIDLHSLNLNIVKYNNNNSGPSIIKNCNINKLILNENVGLYIENSTINDIYIQSKIYILFLINSLLPNLHARVDLINRIVINQ